MPLQWQNAHEAFCFFLGAPSGSCPLRVFAGAFGTGSFFGFACFLASPFGLGVEVPALGVVLFLRE